MPWNPGDGPFHIKGVAYRGHMVYVQEYVPGGIAEMLAGCARATRRSRTSAASTRCCSS